MQRSANHSNKFDVNFIRMISRPLHAVSQRPAANRPTMGWYHYLHTKCPNRAGGFYDDVLSTSYHMQGSVNHVNRFYELLIPIFTGC